MEKKMNLYEVKQIRKVEYTIKINAENAVAATIKAEQSDKDEWKQGECKTTNEPTSRLIKWNEREKQRL